MADKYLVFQSHSFANETVRRNLTSSTDGGTLLNFNEGPDLRVLADFATVEVHKVRMKDLDALTQGNS
jgi:hypothetical protein